MNQEGRLKYPREPALHGVGRHGVFATGGWLVWLAL